MRINRTNYEHYLIDYLEGKLSKQDKETIKCFLTENPDIAGELESLNLSEAAIEETKDTLNKENLFKSFHDITYLDKENYEEFCIAYHEDDLDDASKQRLLSFIDKNPELKSLFDFHGKIRLQPDTSIRFPGKKELKKVRVIPLQRIIYSVSAGVAAAAAIFLLWISLSDNQKIASDPIMPVAKTDTPSQIQTPGQEKEFTPDRNRSTKTLENKMNDALHPEFNLLAAVDTSDTRQLEKIVLAELKPRSTHLKNEVAFNDPDLSGNQNPSIQPDIIAQKDVSEKPAPRKRYENKILQRNKILYSAVNISIKGFNTLTESQLALHTSQDDDGNLTGIAIDSDNFGFIRKIQRNNQN